MSPVARVLYFIIEEYQTYVVISSVVAEGSGGNCPLSGGYLGGAEEEGAPKGASKH